MTNETIHDGDIEFRPEDAPKEWIEFQREARFQARIREGHSAKVKLFPRGSASCDGLCDDPEDDCDDTAIAVVTDDHEITGRRHLCEIHFSLYLSDVIPAVRNWEEGWTQMILDA